MRSLRCAQLAVLRSAARRSLSVGVAVGASALWACSEDLVDETSPDVCYSQKRWIGGVTGNEEMFPGGECVGCHRIFDGPEFMAAGTDDFLWTVTEQTRDATLAPDPFDPLKADPRWANVDPGSRPYALRPLILSAGPDKAYDIAANQPDMMATGSGINNDPYLFRTTQPYNALDPLPGTPIDSNGDGGIGGDNITNHDNTAQ